jgi:hypothetical protein
MVGRPKSTGIFASRAELEAEVARLYLPTSLTMEQVARYCGVSVGVVQQIIIDRRNRSAEEQRRSRHGTEGL